MDHTDRDIQLDFKPARHMASPMGDRDEVVISARLVPSEQRQVNPNRDKSFTSLEIPVDARTVEELPGRDLPLLPTNPHVELLTAGRLTSDKATSIALFEGTMDVLMGRVAWLDGAMKRARYFNN